MHLEEIFTNATAPAGDSAPMPKAMLVFAHPDDETIALGGRLARFHNAHLVHVTDGAPRNEQDSGAHGFPSWREYRDARAAELTAALSAGAAREVSRECLGFADQEASLHLPELTALMANRLSRHRPAVVFTHPYEGGHPDHDACAFAVHHAVADIERHGGEAPLIIEAPFYHSSELGFVAGEFLCSSERMHEVSYALMREDLERKRKMLACFTTQQETLHGFAPDWERFRVAPGYDFTAPPAASVLYDRFPWGMTSAKFCELAAEAEHALQQETVPACR